MKNHIKTPHIYNYIMSTIIKITRETYKTDYANKVGTSMFPNEYSDVLRHTNIKKLRKTLEAAGDDDIKGCRILHILVKTNPTNKYVNEMILYKYGMSVERDDYPFYTATHPLDDVIVVYTPVKQGNRVI